MSRFIQITSTVIPQVDGAHADEFCLHALDEDGRVWRYVDDRFERTADGRLVYDADDRAKKLPPRWEALTSDRQGTP
jgi:hypothetical protein